MKLYDGFPSSELNALYTAIVECGKDDAESRGAEPNETSYIEWLSHVPKTTMTVELIDKLHDLGFRIQRTVKE